MHIWSIYIHAHIVYYIYMHVSHAYIHTHICLYIYTTMTWLARTYDFAEAHEKTCWRCKRSVWFLYIYIYIHIHMNIRSTFVFLSIYVQQMCLQRYIYIDMLQYTWRYLNIYIYIYVFKCVYCLQRNMDVFRALTLGCVALSLRAAKGSVLTQKEIAIYISIFLHTHICIYTYIQKIYTYIHT